MNLTEYAASQLFIRAVNFLSRFQNIKFLGVNEAYYIQIQKIEEFKQDRNLDKALAEKNCSRGKR